MLRRARIAAGEKNAWSSASAAACRWRRWPSRCGAAPGFATSREARGRSRQRSKPCDRRFDSGEEWGVKADIVIESVGPATWERWSARRAGGRLVVCGGNRDRGRRSTCPSSSSSRSKSFGSTMGSYTESTLSTKLVSQGLPVAVDATFPIPTTRRRWPASKPAAARNSSSPTDVTSSPLRFPRTRYAQVASSGAAGQLEGVARVPASTGRCGGGRSLSTLMASIQGFDGVVGRTTTQFRWAARAARRLSAFSQRPNWWPRWAATTPCRPDGRTAAGGD